MNKYHEFFKNEGNTFPGKTYIEELLKPIFYDQRDFLFEAMFDIHRAHVIMLTEQQIIKKDEAKIMLNGIDKVSKSNINEISFDPKYEDLFFMMEAKIAAEIGDDLAGNIHIGRSRNDMGAAMYRLVLREQLLRLIGNGYRLSEVLLEQSERHAETYMTAYTHTQPAQPTTLGHYFLAIYDVFQRDLKRLWAAYETVNQSPLGAAALSTTGFPISRSRMLELLGFDRVVENSYDSIAGADYLLETAAAIMTCMVNTGRWIQDFLLYLTREFGAFMVADPYVQVSSIMPQKRNPVSVEHSRSLASSSVGEVLAAIQMIHNTPFGDIVDTEDDLQPHLYRAFAKANRVMKLMYVVILTLQVNKEHLKAMSEKSCITITELADTLTRKYNISFRKAHSVASSIATKTCKGQKELNDWKIEEINFMIQEFIDISLTEDEWKDIISPEYFVKIRSIQGGPNPDEVRRMNAERKLSLGKRLKEYEQIVDEKSEKEKQLREFVI